MKFSVGDKVRLTEEGSKILRSAHACVGFDTMVAGLVGTVKRSSGYETTVRFDGHPYPTNGHATSDGWNVWGDGMLELVAPVAPRFKIGDRVKVVGCKYPGLVDHTGMSGEVVRILAQGEQNISVRLDGRTDPFFYFDDELALIPPYTPRHVFAASQVSHIDDETIDRWVDEGVKNVDAQKTLNFENPSYTAKSGDALVVVENGKVYLYRLEGVKNV